MKNTEKTIKNTEKTKPFRGSFSTCIKYHRCQREFYYNKILKLPDGGDKTFAIAGNVVHNIIEDYYNKKIVNDLSTEFDIRWRKKGLPEMIDIEKGKGRVSYKKMFHKALMLRLYLSHVELRILFPNFLYIIDGVENAGNDNNILDWKTSYCKNRWNEPEYTLQMKCYALGYYRKYGVLPNKCTVYYLNTGEIIEILPDMTMIKETDLFFSSILRSIESKHGKGIEVYECCDECGRFCPYKERCAQDNNVDCKDEEDIWWKDGVIQKIM